MLLANLNVKYFLIGVIVAKAYSKEDVVEAALMKFAPDIQDKLRGLYNEFYDVQGKDRFRSYASVTPKVMKTYFEKKSCL
jgi:hypothetical protein